MENAAIFVAFRTEHTATLCTQINFNWDLSVIFQNGRKIAV